MLKIVVGGGSASIFHRRENQQLGYGIRRKETLEREDRTHRGPRISKNH